MDPNVDSAQPPVPEHYKCLCRYLCLAFWVLRVVDNKGYLVEALGAGPWAALVLVAEVVQSFILADFTMVYIQSYARGLPSVRIGGEVA